MEHKTVGIVGGGVSGSTVALKLANLGIDVILFEKDKGLVSGPPMCHLHAGGNLYREIPDEQCVELLKQSIDVLKLYNQAIDFRPTVITVPKIDEGNPEDLFPRLELLKREYKKLIEEDESNKVLGAYEDYYKSYSKAQILDIVEKNGNNPFEKWIVSFAKITDLEKIKFPIFLVQEYGWNMFRVAASVTLALKDLDCCKLCLETEVNNITDISKNDQIEGNWLIHYNNANVSVDYLVNACGFETGKIDDQLQVPKKRMVEFKAAYIAKWDYEIPDVPEIIFHGERSTPHGMAQLTPYPGNNYQIHGMTEKITLFKNGLVSSTEHSAQPRLSEEFIERIEHGWSEDDIKVRTQRAIDFVANYVPQFKSAKIGGRPLFGAQQIVGKDSDLRVADVAFDKKYYARCETIKASSVLSASNQIIRQLIKENVIDPIENIAVNPLSLCQLTDEEVTDETKKIVSNRDYPSLMSYRLVEKNVQ